MDKKKFAEQGPLNLVDVNNVMLEAWQREHVFEQSVTCREGAPEYVFYEGPPSANGHPGIHHVLARAIKDTFNRYKTMQGFQVKRKAGWDTHGLPVELGVEKELGITKKDIDNKASERYISVADYNRHCRENVMKYTAEWRTLTEEMGYFVDLDRPYVTYESKYMETLWWLLRNLYDKGLLYKGYTIQPYSPAAGTGLSSHELNQPGCYKDVKDTTVTALFRLTHVPDAWKGWGEVALAAWTTTPWTLPSNTALCVGPTIDYVVVRTYHPYTGSQLTMVLAESRLTAYFHADAEVKEGALPAFDKTVKNQPFQVIDRCKGTGLVGLHYEQLMPWVTPCERLAAGTPSFVMEYAGAHPEAVLTTANGKERMVLMGEAAFRVIPGDYVTTDDGTGIVHIAPTFGADDAKVARDAGVPGINMVMRKGEWRPMVDLQGKYPVPEELDANFVEHCLQASYQEHAGCYVKNAYDPKFNPNGVWDKEASEKEEDLNLVLVMEMKQSGQAFKIEKHVHSYPHCWRTDKPVLYYPLDAWFIKTTEKKERMVELNKTINWQPESTGSGRFGNWLENLNDWNLSRSRFWGTPLPIWRDEDGAEKCIGSVEELYNEIEKAVAAGIMTTNPLKDNGFVPGNYSDENYQRIDLHRPYVDEIVLVSPAGKPMYRESDLIDVWFDSGAMPYAQIHYPFENRELIDEGKAFPADFINEGVDQTRGWFFTLHAIATMVFDSVAFKNVISTGLVLDAKGNKMSKHVGNVTNPFDMLNAYGADAVRFYMMTNSEPWDNLKFDPEGVDEVRRKLFGTLHNTYSFFALYANVDGFDPTMPEVPYAERPEIDRWVLSALNSLVSGVVRELDGYNPTRAGRLIDAFVNNDLSNWYVRLNRKRFWGKEMSSDKLSAYQTLYTCLLTVSKLLAPLAPFYCDKLYRSLTGEEYSVHLVDYPKADTSLINGDLEEQMEMAQRITSMTLALRRKVNMKVRQPLQQLLVPLADAARQERLLAVKDLILSEVNVKELKFVTGEGLLVKRVKCNFRTMGKKFGKLMKEIAAAMAALTQEEIAILENTGQHTLNIGGEQVIVDAADVEIISEDMPGWLVANEGNLTVALEVELTEELRNEGMARELINRIQNLRKDSGLEITDRIIVRISPNAAIEAAVNHFADYMATQVLADSITVAENEGAEVEFDDFMAHIDIQKVQ